MVDSCLMLMVSNFQWLEQKWRVLFLMKSAIPRVEEPQLYDKFQASMNSQEGQRPGWTSLAARWLILDD